MFHDEYAIYVVNEICSRWLASLSRSGQEVQKRFLLIEIFFILLNYNKIIHKSKKHQIKNIHEETNLHM